MTEICTKHDEYILIAIEEAKKANSDVPVGALIVKNNEIIVKSYNLKEEKNDPTGHAEIIAIREAANKLGSWRLDNTSLYVTLEPCPMCASAILYSRIPNVYFGAYDPLYGAFGSAVNMNDFIKFQPSIIGGIQEEKCREILQDFFRRQREL